MRRESQYIVRWKDKQRTVRRGCFCWGRQRKEVSIGNRKREFAGWRMRMRNTKVPI